MSERKDDGIDSEIPEGWSVVTLGDVVDLNPAKPGADALPVDAPVTFVPMPAVDAESGSIASPQVRPFASVRKAYTPFQEDDVLFAKITPCMENGKAAVAKRLENRLGFGSSEFHVLRPTEAVISHYVYHYIRQEAFRRAAAAEMTGSVGQKRVPPSFVELAVFPLPPVAEQRRIVAKIEALLARVTAAREHQAKVRRILKRFRQSVLAAACSGRLTEDWQESLGAYEQPADAPDLPSGWRRRPLRELCDGFQYGTARKSEKQGRVAVLRMGNIQEGAIDWTDLAFTSDSSEIERYRLEPGTVLFNRTNSPELVGKTGIYRGERPAIFAGYLIKVVHGPELNAEYLNFCLNSPEFKEYCLAVRTDGVSQSNINARKLAAYQIPWCELDEQAEIIRRAAKLFAMADAAEKRLKAAQIGAEGLTQSILAKAFRGELVPTEADLASLEGRDYEPASVVLDRIQAERGVKTDRGRNRSMRERKRGTSRVGARA